MELRVIVLVRHCYVKSQRGYSLCLFNLTVSYRFGILAYWRLRQSWHLSVCGDARRCFCCPDLCWEIIINDLNHQIIDCGRVSWQLCLGLTNMPVETNHDPSNVCALLPGAKRIPKAQWLVGSEELYRPTGAIDLQAPWQRICSISLKTGAPASQQPCAAFFPPPWCLDRAKIRTAHHLSWSVMLRPRHPFPLLSLLM